MRHHLLFASIAGLAIAGCSGNTAKFEPRIVGAVVPTGEEAMLDQARATFERGNIALALDGYRKIARIHPESVAALNGIAACYDRMGRYDLSRRYYEQALALDPADFRTRHNFQYSLRIQGRIEEAAALDVPAAIEAEGAQDHAAATPHRPVADTASPAANALTIALPEPAAAAAARVASPHLKRLSLGEIALVTTQPSPAPAVRPVQSALSWDNKREPALSFPKPQAVVTARVEVLNGVGRRGLAARYRAYLKGRGLVEMSIADARNRHPTSRIIHTAGTRAEAQALARELPFPTKLEVRPRGNMLLVLGSDSLAFDDRLKGG